MIPEMHKHKEHGECLPQQKQYPTHSNKKYHIDHQEF